MKESEFELYILLTIFAVVLIAIAVLISKELAIRDSEIEQLKKDNIKLNMQLNVRKQNGDK